MSKGCAKFDSRHLSDNLDKDRARSEELLQWDLLARKIGKVLGYSNHIGLNTYIKKCKIRESLQIIG
jgi:hypothetical protein